MTIALASDHAGFNLKKFLVRKLRDEGYEVLDLGPHQEKSVDYPEYAKMVAEQVGSGRVERGVLVCGSGVGMSIAANKFPGVRCALVHDTYYAKLSRLHNDANIIALGGRVIAEEFAWEIVTVFLETPFSGGRHSGRIKKIREFEDEKK